MIIPLVGQELAPKTNDVSAREIQTLIDASDLLPKLDAWLFCTKCKTPFEGSNGFNDPVWTLRCRCTTHRYQRRPV